MKTMIVLVFICAVCLGDEVVLTNGIKFEGKVSISDGIVNIEIKRGLTIGLKRSEVLKITYLLSREELKEQLKPQDVDTISQKLAYAEWCVKNGFHNDAKPYILIATLSSKSTKFEQDLASKLRKIIVQKAEKEEEIVKNEVKDDPIPPERPKIIAQPAPKKEKKKSKVNLRPVIRPNYSITITNQGWSFH